MKSTYQEKLATTRIRVGHIAILLTLMLATSPLPRAAAYTITTDMLFTSLDGSVDDQDPTPGIFGRNDGLLITSTGKIRFPDLAATNNSSAGAISLNIGLDFEMQSAAQILAENTFGNGTGGAITIHVGGDMLMRGTGTPLTSARISSRNKTSSNSADDGGDIAITVGGAFTMENGSTITSGLWDEEQDIPPAGDISVTARTIDVDGAIRAESRLSGGGSGRAGGGPITLIAKCDLNVGDTGVVSSRGQDQGPDLVHLQGCDVTIHGVVQSIGPAHATNTDTATDPPDRPDKPLNSTAAVEIWAGGKLVIDATNGHFGQINADVGQSGGSEGISWIDLLARGDIDIKGLSTGSVYAVHANSNFLTNDHGGEVTVKSVGGEVRLSGLALQALANMAGGDGGDVIVEALLDAIFAAASIDVRGGNTGGGVPTGGNIDVRSFLGNVSWTGGVGNADGNTDGTIDLIAALSIITTGTIFTPSPTTTPNNNLGGAPSLEQYVLLQDCEDCDPAAIPEPATWMLATLGVGALGVVALRKRRAPRCLTQRGIHRPSPTIMGRPWLLSLITMSICLVATRASAGTITDTAANGGFGGTGFGNILSLLVLHANVSEFGSATWNGSALVKTDDATNQSDVQSAATLAANGHGATFPLVLNLGEQGNAPEVTIHDFTLRFFAADGSTLFDIVYDLPDAGQELTDSGGTGQSGRVFTVALSAGESASFYANGNNRLGMFVTEANAFEDTGGGPDNFYVPKSEENVVSEAESVPEPATWIFAALGACTLGARALRRERANRRVTRTTLMNNEDSIFKG